MKACRRIVPAGRKFSTSSFGGSCSAIIGKRLASVTLPPAFNISRAAAISSLPSGSSGCTASAAKRRRAPSATARYRQPHLMVIPASWILGLSSCLRVLVVFVPCDLTTGAPAQTPTSPHAHDNIFHGSAMVAFHVVHRNVPADGKIAPVRVIVIANISTKAPPALPLGALIDATPEMGSISKASQRQPEEHAHDRRRAQNPRSLRLVVPVRPSRRCVT